MRRLGLGYAVPQSGAGINMPNTIDVILFLVGLGILVVMFYKWLFIDGGGISDSIDTPEDDRRVSTNVFGYVRVSTKEQQLDVQIDAIKEYCSLQKLNLVRIFKDKPTEKTTDREEFQEMVVIIENDNISSIHAIIVYSLDRVGRSHEDFLNFVDWCEKHNIKLIIIHITEPFDRKVY
jgi:hypothetical protein